MNPLINTSATVAIAKWLQQQRWFGGKGRAISRMSIFDLADATNLLQIRGLNIEYLDASSDGNAEQYWVAWPDGWNPDNAKSAADVPNELIGEPSWLAALWNVCRDSNLVVWRDQKCGALKSNSSALMTGKLMHFDQSNTCIEFRGEGCEPLILKLYRKLTPGKNPDAEIGRGLSEAGSHVTPPLRAILELAKHSANIGCSDEAITFGVLNHFVPNDGSAWDVLLKLLRDVWKENELESSTLREFVEAVAQKTAELHTALSSINNSAFSPEQFTLLQRAELQHSQRSYASEQFALLKMRLSQLPPASRDGATQILDHHDDLLQRFRHWKTLEDAGLLIRIHGDYHLGQLLVAEIDENQKQNWESRLFVVDFEGEPARPLDERRSKRSPLQDVAGMVRSLHYAVSQTQLNLPEIPNSTHENAVKLFTQMKSWFLNEYKRRMTDNRVLPTSDDAFHQLLSLFILDKACYELGYELNNRPDWVQIPLLGILDLLES